jgi:hypothetical protein
VKKVFYILLIINFALIIVVPVIISLLGIEDDWAAYYTMFVVIPVFFVSLLILLGFVLVGLFRSFREKEPDSQSNE